MFGGFGGMGGRNKNAKVDNERYYQVLGVKKNATDAEIKKAYRKKAVKEHPDKGGDRAKWDDIDTAYKTLSDPQKRAAYDKWGEEGMKQPGAAGAQDFFGQMFGDAQS